MKRSVAFAVVSGMAIFGLAADVAPETALMHRWSFGDWTDSVGGATAQKGGTYASLYGGRVHLGYGSSAHGTGYVELGANLLDTAAATIELWARHDGVAKWSRIFDYGVDDEHYFQMPWTYDTNISKDRVGAKNGGSAGADAEDTMAPYAIGADYYIAATFEKDGDGTRVKWQRRDAATGEEQKSGALTIPGGMWSFVDPVLYLGHSQFPADCDAMAAYDEVRIWRGALPDATLAASAKAGPDATITMADGAPQFAAAEPPPPPAQREAMPEGGYRIMTYNIQYCYDENSTIVEDRTAARIIAENPDFCLLNEIRDSNAHPEATMLAKLTGMHKTHNHNTILSKEAPLNVESYDLPYASYGDRGLVVCEFSNVVVAVTHLDVGAAAFEARTNSIDIIRAALAKYAGGGKPVILGGDWNARPSSTEVAMMKEFMTIISPLSGARTYHNHDATGGYIIDYIAVDTAHAADIYTADSFVVDDYVTSDHNPVIAEVYLRPQASELGWVDERFLSAGRTGTWKGAVRWDAAAWAAELFGENVFEPLAPSGGNVVEFEVTAAFDTLPDELATPDASAQGALWLGANGNFQSWSPEGWLDAAADGVAPATGVEYTFRFTFDYRAGCYSVAILDEGAFKPLAVNGETSFPLAVEKANISRVGFSGNGALRSLVGRFENMEITLFAEDEDVAVKDGIVQLSAPQADWLNAFGGKPSVASPLAGLSRAEFIKAYLLNLNVMDEKALEGVVFEVTGMNVEKESVVIGIRLVRPGAVEEDGVRKAINGTLRIYGAPTLREFAAAPRSLGDAELEGGDFAGGETATATIPLQGQTPPAFFKATIE